MVAARRALSEFQIEGVATNLSFCAALLDHPDVAANQVTTRWLDAHAAQLVSQAAHKEHDFDSWTIGHCLS